MRLALIIGLMAMALACRENSPPAQTPGRTPATCAEARDQFTESLGDKASGIPAASFRDRELCWEAVLGAVRYDVTLTVQWYGNCDVWHKGRPLAEDAITTQMEVPAGTTSLPIAPPDPDSPAPKTWRSRYRQSA